MAKYKIEFDEEACIGCGACEAQCQENWVIDIEKQKAKPKKVLVDDFGCNNSAAEVCPVSAIKLKALK